MSTGEANVQESVDAPVSYRLTPRGLFVANGKTMEEADSVLKMLHDHAKGLCDDGSIPAIVWPADDPVRAIFVPVDRIDPAPMGERRPRGIRIKDGE